MFICTPVLYVQVEYETDALYVSLIKIASLLLSWIRRLFIYLFVHINMYLYR